MATLTVKTNLAQVTGIIQEKLNKLKDREYLLRPVAFGCIDLITKRIHHDGRASDGSQIGIYSSGYLAYRQKKHNRSKDPTVIISLTRQLENNYSVIATDRGYGIGFLNAHNYDKSQWVQAIYKKRIFDLTQSETTYAIDYINDLVNEALK